MWTDHCLQTGDSAFPSALEQLTTDVVVHKGINQFVDAYSAFADNTHNLKTELDNILKQQGITKLYIVGIATDVCVTYTTRDAVLYGYEVVVVGDATAGIFPDTEASALSSFGALPNVTVMDTAEVLEAKCKRRRRRNAGKWGGLQGAKVLDEYAPHWTKWAGSWARKLAPGYTPAVLNEFDHVHFMQHELLLSERKDPRRIVLLCQTNVAVDGVLLRLLNHGWDRFARLGSFKAMAPQLLSSGAGLAKERKALVKDFSEALKHQVGLDEPTAQALRQSVERGELPPRPSVWRKRRVLATTLAALEAADHLGEALRCPLVLVDEAAQLTEPQLFAALSRVSAECVLLLGDPRQLPPRAAHSSLQLSALARLPPQLELTTQFRCHPDIGELCSQLFYGGRLKSGVSKEARGSVLGPNHSALAVVLSQGLECRVGQSFRHDAEARAGAQGES
ncbi:unnamed protein product [Effrenium voratum]|nr:unnamed protein product [Effrenium voratum]